MAAFLCLKTLSEEEKMAVVDITETEKVEGWVAKQLLEAGCPATWALKIAGYGVDSHTAVDLWAKVARTHEANRAGEITAKILCPINPGIHRETH